MARHEIDYEAIYPRDAEHRYRIYARSGRSLEVIACSPDPGGVGVALVQIDEDMRDAGGSLGDLGQIGVLDAVAHRWIVLPWNRPEARATVGHLPKELRA